MTKNCSTYLGAENNENHLELMSVFGDAFHLQGKLGVTVGVLIEGSIVRDLCLKIGYYQIKFFLKDQIKGLCIMMFCTLL